MHDTGAGAIAPHRGQFGGRRPAALRELALPPAPMPPRLGTRPLKAWRYVGVFGPELMLCLALVRIGRARQSFWAVWDRRSRRLYERTTLRAGEVTLALGRARIDAGAVRLELALDEQPGVECVCASGAGYGWTRKQGGIAATGTLSIGDAAPIAVSGRAVVDDTAAYYERHTSWRWSAGVGSSREGRAVAWNLVAGINDPARGSERTIWIDGVATEAPLVMFAPDLAELAPAEPVTAAFTGPLRFAEEAVRARSENLLLIRSRYRQPFGTFSGALPDGTALADGYGVMESHDVWW
jgi:Domain of unknown function (DUF2804), C-terminal